MSSYCFYLVRCVFVKNSFLLIVHSAVAVLGCQKPSSLHFFVHSAVAVLGFGFFVFCFGFQLVSLLMYLLSTVFTKQKDYLAQRERRGGKKEKKKKIVQGRRMLLKVFLLDSNFIFYQTIENLSKVFIQFLLVIRIIHRNQLSGIKVYSKTSEGLIYKEETLIPIVLYLSYFDPPYNYHGVTASDKVSISRGSNSAIVVYVPGPIWVLQPHEEDFFHPVQCHEEEGSENFHPRPPPARTSN